MFSLRIAERWYAIKGGYDRAADSGSQEGLIVVIQSREEGSAPILTGAVLYYFQGPNRNNIRKFHKT